MLENLRLTRIVVHEILTASALGNGKSPQHSGALITMDADGKGLVCERLIDSIGSDSHCEEMLVGDQGTNSSFQTIAKLFDADDTAFITSTASLADKLSGAQTTGSIREGLGVFIEGTGIEGGETLRWIAIIKADPDRGFVKVSSAHQIILRYVADLVMGAQQRMLKVALFVENIRPAANQAVRDSSDFSVKVYDHLLSNSGRGTSAFYFYATFLGLKPADNSAKQCRTFYEETRKFTDEFSTDAAEKALYRDHLASYLRSERSQISVKDFSDTYIPQAHRRAYLRKMRDARVPDHAIRRDIALIKTKLKKQSMRFSSKVVIIVPDGTLQDQIRFGEVIQMEGNDWTELKIKGKLE